MPLQGRTQLQFAISNGRIGPSVRRCHDKNAIKNTETDAMKNRTGISLRLTPDEREALDALKSYLGENTATRALLHVIRLYPSQHRALQATLAELDKVQADRDRLLQAVAAAEQGRADLIATAAEIATDAAETKYET